MMIAMIAKSELLATLRAQAMTLGLSVREEGGEGLVGEMDSIRNKWFLGGRKVSYRMSCRLDEAARVVRFREAVVERSWGLPPPTLTVEKSTVHGRRRSGEVGDASVGGGGAIDYGRVREVLGQVVSGAGWQFQFESGRAP
jgi:hypothetical protein